MIDAARDEALWYLKVLKIGYSVYQPEIRRAIDYAIDKLEKEKKDVKQNGK